MNEFRGLPDQLELISRNLRTANRLLEDPAALGPSRNFDSERDAFRSG